MLALLESQLQKNCNDKRKVPCLRTPRGTQYDVHSLHTLAPPAHLLGRSDSATPSVVTQAAKFPL